MRLDADHLQAEEEKHRPQQVEAERGANRGAERDARFHALGHESHRQMPDKHASYSDRLTNRWPAMARDYNALRLLTTRAPALDALSEAYGNPGCRKRRV